ncbi:MAG: SNF2-related protein, partial [Chitinophagaceae bacterium]
MATFGKTWWGQQWLHTLSNIDYDNRLPRGATYARKGAVTKITIKENQINAKVAGSRPKPYKVDVILPPFFEPELGKFIQALASKPVIISKLLNRELDPEVLVIAEQMGLKVFPKQWTDFKMQCSCPDWAVPCKHLAAVIYKVSAEIDNNPFLVFDLHKVDLIAELKKLGIVVSKDSLRIPRLSELYFDSFKKKAASYDPENAYKKLSFSDLSPIHEPLTALLADNPVFYQGNGNFKETYCATLGKVVRNAQKVVQGKIALQSLFIKATQAEKGIAHRDNNHITIDEKYQPKIFVNDTQFSFLDFLHQLAQVPSAQTTNFQPSTASLHTVLHFATHLLANGAIVPQIVQLEKGGFSIRWLPAMLSKAVRELVEKLENILPPAVFIWEEKTKKKPINKNAGFNLLSLFITEIIQLLNDRAKEDLFENLFFSNQAYAFNKPGEEALSGGILVWLQKYFLAQGQYKPQIVVEELPNENFQIIINVEGRANALDEAIPLREILNSVTFAATRYEVLQSLTQLSAFIPGLDAHINSGANEPIVMSNETFTPFLLQIIPAIQLLDINILLPKALQEILKPKPSLKLKRKSSNKSFIRLDQLLDFDWQIAIGDNLMEQEEFSQLMQQSEGLIKYKTSYIYVNAADLQKIHRHFATTADFTPIQLLRTALTGEYAGAKIGLTDEVKALIHELTNFQEIPLPKGINASLRPYQVRGYSWMYRNAQIGFGSVIADDMGLGKTLQVITTILKYKEDGLLMEEKALVVVPTGLLTNWQAEIEKFAPSLKTKLFHGTNRKLPKDNGYDILLTSYGIARSDASNLKKMKWHTLIIDEAQNIKNQDTAQ